MSIFKKRHNSHQDIFSIQEGGYKYGHLNNFSFNLQWVENSYFSENKNLETVSSSFNLNRLYFFSFMIVFFLCVIFVRAVWLQIIKNDYYYSMAEGNRIRIERIEPQRGIIYDRNKQTLVRNVANFMLYLVPSDLYNAKADQDAIVYDINNILGKGTSTEIKDKLSLIKPGSLESYQPLFVADNIEYDKAMRLYLSSANWPGVILSNKTRREYDLNSFSLSHILGYTGKINENELVKFGSDYQPIDYIGKTGIEYFWENEIKGVGGKKQVEVDALGKEKKIISKTDPVDGRNLVLTIDADLQKKAEEALANSLAKLKLRKGAIIILDPNNGEVLALVSLPGYDTNKFARGISQAEYDVLSQDKDLPMFDRAISGEYPSGSTIKPVMSIAALEEGIINENTTFLSTGGLRVGAWFFPDWKAGGHGIAGVKRAIAESINTFYYYIGGGYNDFQGLGLDRIARYFKLFGLGAQTGIDLPGEADGFIPSKEWKEEAKGEKWYVGDTYHISIGQGDLLVTPLQVALYTSVFANGGKLYRPHLIHQVLNGSDLLLSDVKEDPIRQNFVSPANMEIVRAGMRQTITSGSGRRLSNLGVEVAGKTGTAQNTVSKIKTHSWFTAFAPYQNAEIVITILAEEAGGGDTVAVPIAQEILEWYFRRAGKIKPFAPATSTAERIID